jgi:MFS family permease
VTSSVDRNNPVETEPAPLAWALLLVVCGALFLEGIDIAMLNVAVPAISDDLGLEAAQAHWVISAYVLGYAGFMLLGGRVADLLGRRRVFLTALWVFVGFSIVGGVADSGWMLILARFATGVAAAFMTPAGFSIVTTAFAEGPARDRALAIYGAVGAGGFTLGMVVGGLLSSASWRWVFFAPVVIGAVLLVVGHRMIRADGALPSTSRASFDVAGALTVTGSMVALIFAVVSGSEYGYDTTSLLAFAVAALLAAVFVGIERRSAAPLVRLGLLREGVLAHASIAGLLFMGAFFGFQFALTLYLQELRDWTPLEVGLTFAIMGADLALAPIVAPWLVARFGNVVVMTAGFAAALVSYVLTLRLDGSWGYVELLPSLLCIAVAFALVYGPLTSASAEGIDEAEHGVAGGVVYTAFQFGGALGLSAVTTVLFAGGDEVAGTGDYQRALLVPVIGALLALIVGIAACIRRGRVPVVADLPAG